MLVVRISVLAVVGLLASVVGAPAAGAMRRSPATPIPEAGRTTAILVAATNQPFRLAGSDGSDRLEYDLLVANVFDAPVTLTEIDAIAPDGGVLLRLDGPALVRATQPLFGQEPTPAIPASGAAAVIMDVVLPHDQAAANLTHRITYALAPDAPARSAIARVTVDGPDLAVDPRPPIAIAPPLRGESWLAANGCCAPTSGHRSFRVAVAGARIAKPETFAIDWIQTRDGKLYAGDGTRNAQWFGYGAPLLAVADGTVVAVRDGMAEEQPGQSGASMLRPGDGGGNSVVIEIASGVFAFYAHLQPGSAAVKTGDHVHAGQTIGLLGNTGQSTAPHLHFALLDAPDPSAADSLPLAFDRYTLVGAIDRDAFLAAATGSGATPLAPRGTPRAETATLPLDFTIADFS
jgi:hypothetical protein